MEQTYNHTQDKPSYHTNGLTDKANSLKEAAEALSTKAGQLETAAKSGPLNALRGPAEALRDAAKGSGNTGLYYAAKELATGGTDNLDTKAEAVITKFEEVKRLYTTLMTEAGKLTGLTADQKQKVTAVETEFKALETIYDGMLNLTKLANKSTALKSTAQSHAPELQQAAGDLVSNVTTLRNQGDDNAAHDKAKTVRDNFNDVKDKFDALPDKGSVQTQFDALKGAYGHIGSITLPDLLIPNLNNYS